MPIRLFAALAALALLSLSKSPAMAQGSPNATAYSNTIWRPGSIPTNQVVSSKTPYGILTCRGGTSVAGSRVCSWQRERTGAARPSLKYVNKPDSGKANVSGIVDNTLQTAPPAPVKIALLIGNQAYDASVGALKNPYNDIAIVGASRLSQGFEVLPPIKDGGRSAVFQGVRELVRRLNVAAAGSIGFVYYSGHGAADKDTNINYLIPSDAREPGTPAFWDNSIKLDDVFALLNSVRDAAKFVVFDACRNELRLPTKDTAKGLIPVAEQQGLFIAFASAPGAIASDQGEKSGPYAAALAAELMKPGLDHLNLFQNVKESVLASTGGVQHPWESNGLTRRIYLDRQPKIEISNSAPLSEPAEAWDKVKYSQDLAALESFAAHYKETFYADMARARIEALRK
jgi:Caspase domain